MIETDAIYRRKVSEISENIQRKDFSWDEIIQIKKAIEPEIKKESEMRMLSGKPSANFAEGSRSNTKTTSKNYSDNQTRAKVAKYVSLHGKKTSHATLAKAELVYDAAQQEPTTFGQIWTDLNSEKISPHKAYEKIHENKKVPPQSSTTKATSSTSFDNSELSREEEEREGHRKCNKCQVLQQKCEQLQSRLRDYEEA